MLWINEQKKNTNIYTKSNRVLDGKVLDESGKNIYTKYKEVSGIQLN